MERYEVITCPKDELAFTNRAVLNPRDKFAQLEHIAVRYPNQVEAFVFSVITDDGVPLRKIAFNATGRKWGGIMIQREIEAAPYKFDPQSQCLHTITFLIDFANKLKAPLNVEFNTEEMSKQFSERFSNQAFTVGQLFGFVYFFQNKKVHFELKVKEFRVVNIDGTNETANIEIGLSTANTVCTFEPAQGSEVKLTGSRTGAIAAPRLFNQDWDFSKMGIGGLSEQFNTIFRRAFTSRLLPPKFAESIGEEHVRGILLYGPPGTGKTLIARQIGKMLLSREPKIVNGPEVLNKYVGESEANIRKLFAEAEEEQKKMGIYSGLHMIIFDEIDSLCRARGSSTNSGVGDGVVNQLLSKIDGVDALHNVLLIGMTNRKELIDEALLRPGRLEVQIEIGLPNKEGRVEILRIHTEKMREKQFFDSSVDLTEIAELTKNYTGAELAGLVKAAKYIAVNRIIKFGTEVDEELLSHIKVTQDDFLYAMKHDVKPALGASDDQLKILARPIIQWDARICEIQSNITRIIDFVSQNDVEVGWPYYVLLMGESGSGLTTLAANMALETKFPFVRVYQAKSTAGKTENAKVQYMEKLFEDAARSEQSCVVMDGIETILDYCHIGPRFSNTSRAVLATNKDSILAKGRRMLVICTCKYEPFLNDLMLSDVFDSVIRIPSLTTPEQVQAVLAYHQESGNSVFTPKQCDELCDALGSIPFQMGIKKLELLIKEATRDDAKQRVKKFLERMHTLGMVIRKSRLDHQFGEF